MKLARQPHELGLDLAVVDEKGLWIVVEGLHPPGPIGKVEQRSRWAIPTRGDDGKLTRKEHNTNN